MPEAELNNLARIGQLDKVPFSADLLRKMLATARTRLQDAQRTDNSLETRFDCAYTAIRAVADAALLAQGWRTATSNGHHQTTMPGAQREPRCACSTAQAQTTTTANSSQTKLCTNACSKPMLYAAWPSSSCNRL
jgi:hypothetical protein